VASGTILAATKTTLTLTVFSPTPTLTEGGVVRVEIEGNLSTIGYTADIGDCIVQFDR
jgi:hypothetical protein